MSVVNCPQCGELTPVDPHGPEQRCVVCGAEFYDFSDAVDAFDDSTWDDDPGCDPMDSEEGEQ